MEVVLASSSVDGGIGSWDLHTGAEQMRYKSCASPSHGLVCVGQRFIASSQIRDSSSSGSILFWSWHKPQVDVKSFPAEPIKPLVSNCDGTYIVGGGSSGYIYIWEVASGRLLKRWHAHYRAVTCLLFADDESLLISGAEDGCVRVWSLFMIFDEIGREEAKHLFVHSFSEHTLRITDIVSGYGGCNAIIVSASEDRTCKVWSLSKGNLLRNIVFPSIIDAIALDPGEHVFYAGSRDGKIYIAALNADSSPSNNYGMHVIGSLSDHSSKAVTCLTFGHDGVLLVSGSEDGVLRVWDTKTRNIARIIKHAKGPVNNILVVRQASSSSSRPLLNGKAPSVRKYEPLLLPPLDKYEDPADQNIGIKTIIVPHSTCNGTRDSSYCSFEIMSSQIKELQEQGSAASSEMEIERLKLECERSLQMVHQWKKMYENLHQFCVNELVDGTEAENST